MRSSRVLSVATVALALTAVPLAGTASADPWVTATGTFQLLAPATVVEADTRGRTTHLRLVDDAVVTGELLSSPAGTAGRNEYSCVIVAGKDTFRCRSHGEGALHVQGVGTGRVESRANLVCTVAPSGATTCGGRIRFTGVSGALIGMHASGTFEATGAPGESRYSLRLHRH